MVYQKSHACNDGLSFRYGITAQENLFQRCQRCIHLSVTCPNDTAQAAIEALENGDDDPKEFHEPYRQRRDKLAECNAKMEAFEITALPDGAFYILLKSLLNLEG